MAPCHRCGFGTRSGRGQGWCSNPQCRQAEKEECLAQKSAEKIARQQQRAAQGAGSRGPLREENSRKAERRQLHEERARAKADEEAGGRGPLREEDSKEAERRQLREARARAKAEEEAGGRGPLREEDSKEAERRQLREARARAKAEEEAGGRGPLREEDSKEAERRQLCEARARAKAEEEAGGRGPLREEDSKEAERRQLREARERAKAEEGVGGRGPRPIASEIQQQGYPFPDEDTLTQEQAQAHYLAFARSWSRFGLSRVCQKCQTLTPGRHCRTAKGSGQLLCRNCRENRTKVVLPIPAPIPEALQSLQPMEQHLLAMARISQVLLDKLPSGGPSAQWGRMYAVLMQDPFICDVLEGATLEEDGTVLVEGVDGMTASPARLEHLHAALQALKELHCLYQRSPAVDRALARMAAILANKTSAAAAVPTDPLAGTEANQEIEMTYLVPKQFQAPKADVQDLRKVRGSADLSDGMDAKFFPHLFPSGTGGWQNDNGSFSQYARKRLLSLDSRFEASTAYIMWLLEMQTKKRLSGNINVRIGNQRVPYGSSDYENGSRQVYAALRDMPGTQPYLYAKKGVALNMYEQLGPPNFFMTLSCHARQPALLLAAISARLLRLHPDRPQAELEQHAAEILFRYQNDKNFTWDGLSPNQLCNQQPAVVARQFMHQVSQLMWWLSSTRGPKVHLHEDADPQDGVEENDCEDVEDDAQAPATDFAGLHRRMRKERPPFKVLDYIIRIEWQKRGYPHAHILLWIEEWAKAKQQPDKMAPDDEDSEQAAETPVPDWSDDEAMENFIPRCAEDLSDKYICTKSPNTWRQSHRVPPRDREVNAKLSAEVVHNHTPYCGMYSEGACRFGFPHDAEPRTRRRTSQEQYANSRWKSSLATRRVKGDSMMGQYNIRILRRWRASMDLQVICELTSASRYILGYTFKSEEDREAQRRMENILAILTSQSAGAGLDNQKIYKAAHAALQGRTTSTFEACHLLLGFPIIEFSRDNVWVQVGPPDTWTVWVPKHEEQVALQQPTDYRNKKMRQGGNLPVAHHWYREMQTTFGEHETTLPVEGTEPVSCRFSEVTFLDFCAAFKYIGVQEPQPRRRPAIVGYQNFNPDEEAEAFYYSKLLLHLVWKEPGDWLLEQDAGSHAAAFQRIARDVRGHPDFLRSRCFPQLDGTVDAARKLQAVQATMYMKAKMHPANLRDGWANSKVAEENYKDSLQILEALKERYGGDIDFLAPDSVPTGAALNAFAPVEEGEESFEMLTVENPCPETTRQCQAMEHIVQSVLRQPNTKDTQNTQRLHMLLHGPGGSGKSVVVRAAAHVLRQSKKGCIIAAPTGVAAFNINGVTLHQCCLLPVVNQSHGKACDMPLPDRQKLATLRDIWSKVSVLFVDEMSFIPSWMLERLDQHLRLARDLQTLPFGGLHVIFAGDLYQLPPPSGLPAFASRLWLLFQLCELEGNQRAARDPAWAALLARVRVGQQTDADIEVLRNMVIKKGSKKRPAPKAVNLYATRQAVAESNRRYKEEHVLNTGEQLHDCPAVDTNVKTGAPLSPDAVWAEPENTGGLVGLLQVAIGLRVMLRYNIDVRDGLVNGACGTVEHIDTEKAGGEVERIWVSFEKNAGATWRAEHETSCVAISRRSATYLDRDGSKASRHQFPLVLAKAISIHKSQAATCKDGAHTRLDHTIFAEGQAYVALSRCPEQALCSLELFNPKALRFNANAEWALTKLKAQQADRDGPDLWKALFKPEQNKEFYERRLAEMGTPDWNRLKPDHGERIERPWCCALCGTEAPNTKAAIKAHKRKCPAKPPAKTNAKSKAKAKAKCKAKFVFMGLGKRAAESSCAAGSLAKMQRTGSRPDQDTPAGLYFEAQEQALCGMHALNMALGAAFFTEADMDNAVQVVLEEGGVERGEAAEDHAAPGGFYSSEVLAQVLQTKAMAAFGRVRWQMDLQPVVSKHDLEAAAGAVQNRDNAHWVAYRYFHEKIFRLDSLARTRRAEQIPEAVFLAELARHPATYCIREV